MALEVRVSIGLYDTSAPGGTPTAVVRAERGTTIPLPADMPSGDQFALGKHRLDSLLEDARVDVLGQLETLEEGTDGA